ncbi:MAG: hypothetical protein M0006_07385 [Magnetospirillum sp.]|nr:hypothetical protein [Magnetospirillum sp.]
MDLVLASPAALAAIRVFRAQRWRDACLYAALPLLFAIPLAGSLAGWAMRLATLLFAVDLVGLALGQGVLMRRRAVLAGHRFLAEIPVPDLKITVAAAEIADLPPPHR